MKRFRSWWEGLGAEEKVQKLMRRFRSWWEGLGANQLGVGSAKNNPPLNLYNQFILYLKRLNLFYIFKIIFFYSIILLRVPEHFGSLVQSYSQVQHPGYIVRYHLSYIMYQVSCIMYHVSSIMYHVSSIKYDVWDIMVSCIMYHVSCIMYFFLWSWL